MTCLDSLNQLVNIAFSLGQQSPGTKDCPKLTRGDRFGHTTIFNLCNITWKTSPYIYGSGGEFLVDMLLAHGVFTSGMTISQYDRLCDGGRLGHLAKTKIQTMYNHFAPIVTSMANTSMSSALVEEKEPLDVPTEHATHFVDIETDACHSASRMASTSNIMALGVHHHKVLKSQIIYKDDDPSAQRHETIATRRIHDSLHQDMVNVRNNVHDNNASVSKIIVENGAHDDNDRWHGIKACMKSFDKISSGLKRDHGIKWHEQLSDKKEGVKNHLIYCVMNCGHNADFLRESIESIPMHYSGDHYQCRLSSPCHKNRNYFPSRVIIESPLAYQLLFDWLHKTELYKKPDKYINGMSTFYLESANGALRAFCPKRMHFGKVVHAYRTNCFVLDWNENVSRDGHRVNAEDDNPLRPGRLYHCNKTRNWVRHIWNEMMSVFG